MKKVTVNLSQKVYVIPEGDGYSCLGFDVCEKRAKALYAELATKMEMLPIDTSRKGTLKAYKYYQALCETARLYHERTGYRFNCELTPKLIGLEHKRVEIISDGKKRRFIVGKSTGFIPIHLELYNIRSDGGPAVYLKDTDTVRKV